MKYKILKALDIIGFTFLKPVVLLCYREEPTEQWKKIGQFIAIPILAFCFFLLLWTWVAPNHKTKSGEVPTPYVVWDAATGIWTFHVREGAKGDAYGLEGKSRERQLEIVNQRIDELKPLETEANEQVASAEFARDERIAASIAPLQELYDTKSKVFARRAERREATLRVVANKLPKNDKKLRSAYLEKVREHLDQIEEEKEQLKKIRAKEDTIRGDKFPQLVQARRAKTAIAEERQYLVKLAEQLHKNNRSVKIGSAKETLMAEVKEYYSATGPGAFGLAKNIAKAQQRIDKTAESEYAKPWTLPDQVLRSLACVFFGFVLGSAIAIPIGVLCGLRKTFMAAVTPFIALFKPASPIVWLPIALIIVGGFIPDPDKHWLMSSLQNLPLIGWMKINPAFIASGVTVALCSLWPTLVNTALGVASIDKDHINVARVLRLGFWSRLTKIVVPSALPLIFAGLRISLGVGWMVLIAAELLSSSEGIGKFVWDQFNNGASDSFAKMFVVVFVVGLIGFLLDRIMIIFQRLVSFDGAPAAL